MFAKEFHIEFELFFFENFLPVVAILNAIVMLLVKYLAERRGKRLPG